MNEKVSNLMTDASVFQSSPHGLVIGEFRNDGLQFCHEIDIFDFFTVARSSKKQSSIRSKSSKNISELLF